VIEIAAGGLALAALIFVVPLIGGWRRLATTYPARVEVPVVSPWLWIPYVGAPWCPVWAGVGADRAGIYLEPAFPASLLLHPVFLPWSEVSESEVRFGWHYAELRPYRCTVPVFLVKAFYDEMRSRSGAPDVPGGTARQ
jgi:hypothetical protein